MKAGETKTLKNGVTIKAIPNLAQLITGKDSCVGCYFFEREGKHCPATGFNVAELSCGSVYTEPKEDQVIYVEVKDEGGGNSQS